MYIALISFQFVKTPIELLKRPSWEMQIDIESKRTIQELFKVPLYNCYIYTSS